MSTSPPRVTLVVPVRNEEAHIDACLRSVLVQAYPRELLEVIVVDGGSTDRTAEKVAGLVHEDERIRLVHNPDRTMPTGLNLGIRMASGDVIGVVSGHSVLPVDYVRLAVDALERTGAWSVGGRIVRIAREPMHRAIAVATGSPIGVGDSPHNYATEPAWVEAVFPGMWRREVFDRVGTFDRSMLANEDNELSYRIRRAGGGIWYEPAIAVEYVPRSTLGGLFHQYRRYAIGKVRVFRKHRGGLRWRHLVPAAWVAFVVLGFPVAILSPVTWVGWIAGLVVYLAVVIVAAVRSAGPEVGWWRIALAFSTLHAAYGIGIWQGVFTWRE